MRVSTRVARPSSFITTAGCNNTLFFLFFASSSTAPSYCSFFIWSLLQWVGRAGVTVECTKSSCPPAALCVHDQNLRESGAEWERLPFFSCEFSTRFHAVSKSIHACMKINETFSRIRPPKKTFSRSRIPSSQVVMSFQNWFPIFVLLPPFHWVLIK